MYYIRQEYMCSLSIVFGNYTRFEAKIGGFSFETLRIILQFEKLLTVSLKVLVESFY